MEAMLIASLSATIGCCMIYFIHDCRPLGVDPTQTPVQLFCEDNEYSAVAALWFQTPEATVKALFHDPPGSHSLTTLIIFIAIYYPLCCITFGLSVSLGIFIPLLLSGAAWGRLTAMCLSMLFPQWVCFHTFIIKFKFKMLINIYIHVVRTAVIRNIKICIQFVCVSEKSSFELYDCELIGVY